MQEKIPIKLKSLREVREIIRSSSNRPRIFMSPTFELLKPMSDIKLKLQNQTPTFSRFKKLDSPKSVYENKLDNNIQLIEKANAAIESLENPIKEKIKHTGLLYKKYKGERTLKSGLIYKNTNKVDGSPTPDLEFKLKNGKKYDDFDFLDEGKKKKLTKNEAEQLINRLQGGVKYYKK